MSNLQNSYTRILALLHEIEPENNFLNQIRIPQLSDKELIALNLAAESLGIDSERYLFKRLPPDLSGKIERSVYNGENAVYLLRLRSYRKQYQAKLYPVRATILLIACLWKFANSVGLIVLNHDKLTQKQHLTMVTVLLRKPTTLGTKYMRSARYRALLETSRFLQPQLMTSITLTR